MGQYWKLLSIDKKSSSGRLGKLGEFFWSKRMEYIIDLLTIPIVPPSYSNLKTIPEKRKDKLHKESRTAVATLLTLPVELLLIIAENLLDSYIDVLCLALTCVKMWEATTKIRYQSLSAKIQGRSWAGSRMICLGDCARRLPIVLTAEEREELQKISGTKELRHAASAKTQSKHDMYLLNSTTKSFREYPEDLSIFDDNDKRSKLAFRAEFDSLARIEGIFQWVYPNESEFTSQCAPSKSPEARWMIRNLSKREFVLKSQGNTPRGLVQVLFSLVSWSDEGSFCMPEANLAIGELISGRWSGDRIDVTLLSVHEKEPGNGSDWKDITLRVVDLLRRVGAPHRFLNQFQVAT